MYSQVQSNGKGWCNTMQKKHIQTNGIMLAYEDSGWKKPGIGDNEAHKVIVLLHGFSGSSVYWHQVAPILAEQHRVIVPDLRGHGESEVPEGTYTMEIMADDIAGLLKALNIDRVVLLGHSLGGYVTAAFIERYPDMLDGYGLIHSTVLPDADEVKQKRTSDIEQIRQNGFKTYLGSLVKKLFSPMHLKSLAEEVGHIMEVGLHTTPEGAMRTLEGMMQRPDRSDVAAKSPLPALLVAGAEDSIVAPERTFSIKRAHSTKKDIEAPLILEKTFTGVGHMSMVEVPDQLAQVIGSFVQTLYEE